MAELLRNPPLWEDTKPTWTAGQLLWLQEFPGIGSARSLSIANSIPDPAEFRDAWPLVRDRLGSWATVVPPSDPDELDPFPDARMVGAFDPDYPPSLSRIPNPPAVLWVRGSLAPASRNIAIVGTRHPTQFGVHVAGLAATIAVEAGFGVVSGLALGVDTIAHQSAVEASGYTVAVLGGSLYSPQPRQNQALADRILTAGGALVCETPPTVQPSAATLVARNRLQSGLSVATVVAQSGIPGGTLHTARFTLEQHRCLIVPRPTGEQSSHPASAGNLALTAPGGIDPRVLSATGPTVGLLRSRDPAADEAPSTPAELRTIIRGL